jgi:hypothetical protein
MQIFHFPQPVSALWGSMTAMRFPTGAEIILPRRFAQIRSQDMKR